MAMAEDLGMALDWNSEIKQEAEFELLPEGVYDFTVELMERGHFGGSEKMAPCPSANITLILKDPISGKGGKVFDTLYLSSKAEWRISQFFISIGQKKKGEPLKPNWNTLPGSTGRLELTVNKYKDKNGNEKENNRVGRYLPKENRAFTPGSF